MSILYLLNQTVFTRTPYEKWADVVTRQDVLLTERPSAGQATSAAAMERLFGHVELFDSFEENGMVELRAVELHESHGFCRVVSISESELLRAARVRERCGILGQGVRSALAFRDKHVMKTIAAQRGLRVPRWRRFEDALALEEFIALVGYPVVVKPVSGAGSEGTHVLRGRADLEALLTRGLPAARALLAEEFIAGDMYHVDGMIADGRFILIQPSRYVNSCLSFNEGRFLGSVMLGPASPLHPRLVRFVEELLRALPTPELTLFHAEVFHTPADELVLCEVASRLGGAGVNDALLAAYDLDMKMAYVRAHHGDVPPPQPAPRRLSGWLLMPPRAGVLERVPAECPFPWVPQRRQAGTAGKRYAGASSSVDSIATFALQGDSEEQITERITELAAWFEESTAWRE
ncbi:ATP-grasp domain-containing protein [Sorangium sp. So ce726]|uniref:ATP-grasp domain-containing protein n=1 Tax=Sorangium sp. So ce726 TaxID=3133319 RepID=UPI003F5F9B95